VQATNTRPRFEVVADGQGICSHVGATLLGELSDRLGLTVELGRRANRGVRAGAYDRGQVLRDLVVMLADGGDCVSDLASLRNQPELFGQVCSTPTAWRILAEELPADPRGIAGLWSALARVREQAWALGAAPAGPLILDVDATLVEAHSDKQGAAPTYKHGFGFHPFGCWLDRGDGTGEALAMILRPGNAGSNTTADHVAVLAMALLALPKPAREGPILVRADSAGATHAFVADIVRRNLLFSIGFDCDQRVQAAILALPEQAWQPAVDADGRPRRGAWVAELATLELAGAGLPGGIRAICRRERPHPGAAHKLGFTNAHGQRFQVYITNQPDPDPAVLEARHRPHAQVEDRIRGAKASGLRNLPLWGFAANNAWPEPGHDRPDPGLLGAGAAVGRRPRRRRAQDPQVPAVARGRPDRPARPPPDRAAGPRLALGRRPGRRLHQATGLACHCQGFAMVVGRPGREGAVRCARPGRDGPVRRDSPTR
jgi:Transposase DDE domain group 1